MPPFEYTNLPSEPLTGSLADVIMRGGAIRAQGVQQSAELAAQVQRQRAALWGRTIENLGQLPFQVQAANRADETAKSQAALRESEILQNSLQNRGLIQTQNRNEADYQRKQAGLKAMAQTRPKYQTEDELTGKLKTDYEGYAQDLTRQGFPDLAESELGTYAKNAEAFDKLSKADQARRRTEIDAMADMAAQSKNGDEWLGGLKMLHEHGLIEPKTFQNAKQMVENAGGDWDAVQTQIKGMPGAADAISARALKDAQTREALAKAKKEEAEALAGPKITSEKMDADAQALYTKRAGGQQLSQEEAAQLKGYEDRKGTVAAQNIAASANRQANLIEQQIRLQESNQNFQQAEAGRKVVTKAKEDFTGLQSKMQMIRDTVNASRNNNNQIAGSATALMGALGLVTGTSGVQRVYPFEYDVIKGSGDLREQIATEWNRLGTGQSLSPKLMEDLIKYTQLVEENGATRYDNALKDVVSIYGPRAAPGGYQIPNLPAKQGKPGEAAPSAAPAAPSDAPKRKRFNPTSGKLE